MLLLRWFTILLTAALPTLAQTPRPTTPPAPLSLHRVGAQQVYEHLWAVVPLVGKGTWDDPKRPLFAPTPQQGTDSRGILAYNFVPSDDGLFALVEFVARDKQAFDPLLGNALYAAQMFLKGRAKPEDIEATFRRYRKNFKLDSLGVVLP